MSNAGYRGTPLECLVDDIAALTCMQHVLGDVEDLSRRAPSRDSAIVWRHPRTGTVVDLQSPAEHRPELDVFAEAVETIEMVISRPDYASALWTLFEVYRLGFESATQERDGRSYLNHVEYGTVRRGTTADAVPSDGYTLIDTIKIHYLLPRQEPVFAQAESVSVGGILNG